jgi:PAS domain S-box-containing protein
MKFYFQRKALWGFCAAILIVTWLGVSSYLNNEKYKQSNARVIHTNTVLFHAERILTLIVDIESGQRGFVITGDTVFLATYHSGIVVIRKDLDEMRQLVRDNESQLDRVATLGDLIDEKLKFAEAAIQQRTRNADAATATIATLRGKLLMDKIRAVLHEFQDEEKRLLNQRAGVTEKDLVKFIYNFATLMITTGVILVLVFIIVNRNLKARADAERSLQQALEHVQDMYDNAPCGYHSLDGNGCFLDVNKTELDWLGYSREEMIGKMKFRDILKSEHVDRVKQAFTPTAMSDIVRDVECEVVRKDGKSFPVILNATLAYGDDGQVLRTRCTVFDYTDKKHAEEKILQLNHELEAFSYSVSHDLRAPLRSIDGYARILEEDYLTQLDAEGKRVLSIIIRNANRMGKLIDDLLDFSRLGRKEISKARYSMEALIRSVVDEQLDAEKGRVIQCRIHDIQNALSDPQLIKQVWINLISNALKYSRKKEKSIVEITSQTTGKELIYAIRDNGTGFDMQYAHKLFNVFQRLHKTQDFEGTGVGLAIVHRIISRHGGRVWAEAIEGEGASFFFSLPVEQNA